MTGLAMGKYKQGETAGMRRKSHTCCRYAERRRLQGAGLVAALVVRSVKEVEGIGRQMGVQGEGRWSSGMQGEE